MIMERLFRATVAVLVIIGCSAVPISDELLKSKYEYEFVNIDAQTPQSYSGEKTYNIKTKAFGQDFDLHLKKLPSIFSKNFQFLSLELNKDNEPVYKAEKLKTHDHPVYRDVEKNSVLHVEYKNGLLHLEGILTPELSIVHSSQLSFKNPKGNHVVVKTNFKKTFMDKVFSFKSQRRGSRTYSTVADADIPALIRPEILVVVDYKSTERLEFDTQKIQKYLAVFWHAVNTRYELVDSPQFLIELIGVVATKDIKLQPYIELSRAHSEGKDLIDLSKTLPYLNIFLYNNLKNLPYFDLAMLMTGEDMAGEDEKGNLTPNVAGVAYVASACEVDPQRTTIMSAGMAEDTAPLFDGFLNHAHEVAHILGSAHDGDPPVSFLPGHPGAEDCPWADGYLMSYVFGTKNHLRFSECTVKQFQYFLRQSSSQCLYEMTNTHHVAFNTTLPGSIVSLDDQCRAYMGPDGKYFRGQAMTRICSILYCYYDGAQTATSRGPALEGSPCGDIPGLWCHNGECVRSSV